MVDDPYANPYDTGEFRRFRYVLVRNPGKGSGDNVTPSLVHSCASARKRAPHECILSWRLDGYFAMHFRKAWSSRQIKTQLRNQKSICSLKHLIDFDRNEVLVRVLIAEVSSWKIAEFEIKNGDSLSAERHRTDFVLTT